MEFEQFIPPTSIVAWSVAFFGLRFENQRWLRAIDRGMVGGNYWVPQIVTLAGFLALVLALAVLGVVFWKADWQTALGLLIATWVGGFLASVLVGRVFGGDNIWIWMISTIAIFPVGYLFGVEVIQTYFP